MKGSPVKLLRAALAAYGLLAMPVLAAPHPLTAQLQADLEHYLASRRSIEHISALSLSVSLPGEPGSLDATAGTSQYGGGTAVTPANLFQIGSNTKAFTAVILLQLEAEGRLRLEDHLGKWLPQYPMWREVMIVRLLNMTSGIPTYDNVAAMLAAYAAAPQKNFTPQELIQYVYPTNRNSPAATTGWSYSNTNYLLAQLIIEKVTGHTYAAELQQRFFGRQELRLADTFYAPDLLPAAMLQRMVSGYFFSNTRDNAGLAPLYGKDVHGLSLSWTQGAGGIVATPAAVTHWVRALYQGALLKPGQQQELTTLVSMRTGQPIADVDAADPRGFGLGVGRGFLPAMGSFWFYEGETLGYRMVYVWLPESDAVIAVGINSQPNARDNQSQQLVLSLYQTLRRAGKLQKSPLR
jgi:D-alanyl-D-alanine carboxypeptidase